MLRTGFHRPQACVDPMSGSWRFRGHGACADAPPACIAHAVTAKPLLAWQQRHHVRRALSKRGNTDALSIHGTGGRGWGGGGRTLATAEQDSTAAARRRGASTITNGVCLSASVCANLLNSAFSYVAASHTTAEGVQVRGLCHGTA